jgi:hypothetical protein
VSLTLGAQQGYETATPRQQGLEAPAAGTPKGAESAPPRGQSSDQGDQGDESLDASARRSGIDSALVWGAAVTALAFLTTRSAAKRSGRRRSRA